MWHVPIFCAFLANPFMSTAQPYEPDSLTIALYHLDESGGSFAMDASANGLNASTVGATWITEGRFGGGVLLDGDDYLVIPETVLLDSADLTFEAWVYRDSPAYCVIIDARDLSHPFDDGRVLGIDSSGRAFAGAFLSHVGIWLAHGTSTLPMHEWVHVAAVFAESQRRVAVAVNGIVEGQTFMLPGAHAALIATIGRTRVGTPDYFYFSGRLDEIRVSNTVRPLGPVPIRETTWTAVKSIWR